MAYVQGQEAVNGTVPEARVVVATGGEMRDLGRRLAALLRGGDLLVLSGGLGAGKTTMTQGLGSGLGVRGAVTSPTFVIARVHPSLVGGPALVHVDAYRLGATDDVAGEVDDLDLDASLDESVTVVEWGEGKVEDLTEDRLAVFIERAEGGAEAGPGPGAEFADAGAESVEEVGDDPRVVTVRAFGERWAGVDLTAALKA
ncbi:tRNA (adenosine(37)-N6)-threonylcarbamoyltransferase complex ATPase subunit type 1 TsaE [Yinghuangia sp. YIM S09857]|uniref:tRNA (adenosine(37)-N6)-threonylcarbamoyltransferase complex ATPase subunit type 1 TsaE n=1 Tax=Yinghuangia sp. YIM S09857 TaxID=3436929 RepID=UPI003F52D85C